MMETKSNKRAFSPDTFVDEFDAENVDPNILASPSKKARGFDGAPVKSPKSQFNLITTPVNSPAMNRKTLSLSVPATSNITPISHSRGSPKHKRVGLLSKGRRASSSPFRRVDPPTFNPSGAGSLPFSIDAALSGTISSYKPSSKPVAAEPVTAPKEAKAMPKSWFFAIHEDTPEEEAANLMEHSASTLDISSDDDSETKRQKLESEIGKENVPPPDWCGPTTSRRGPVAAAGAHKGIHSKTKAAEKEEKASKGDLMQEDRSALVALDREDFFPDGLDAKSIEVIDEQKPSALLKEATTFDFVAPVVEKKESVEQVEQEILVRPDSPDREVA